MAELITQKNVVPHFNVWNMLTNFLGSGIRFKVENSFGGCSCHSDEEKVYEQKEMSGDWACACFTFKEKLIAAMLFRRQQSKQQSAQKVIYNPCRILERKEIPFHPPASGSSEVRLVFFRAEQRARVHLRDWAKLSAGS